jgi:MFS family permease
MGVASLAAAVRFDTGAAALSSLAAAQLAIYAAMQIPAGMALDRFGAKKLIVFGSFMTGTGNLIVAFADHLPLAVSGRMIVGFGDAFVFISMIRLINGWVSGPKATRYTQLFANFGQLGQIFSAIPFAYLLGVSGWAPAFIIASSLGFIAACLAIACIKDEPGAIRTSGTVKDALSQFRDNLADPHTRKAFWVHFTLQSSGSVFILLWGYSFLVEAENVPKPLASGLLSSFVLVGFIVGPVLSHLCVRYPERRNRIVTAVYGIIAGAWLLVLLTPGQNPTWQLVILVLAVGIGGPASMAAFDYSRTSIPKHRLGSSNGIINSGGFISTFVCMLLIGVALDLIKASGLFVGTDLYSLAAFKLAFPLQLLVMSIGILMFHRERKLTKAQGEYKRT